jgi:DNA replication initiation complex subunit (GINS family)
MNTQSQSNSTEIPLLTFNSLYNLLREEKKIKTLQKLPDLFYEALEKFLNDKKTEILKLKKEQTNSDSNTKLKKELQVSTR